MVNFVKHTNSQVNITNFNNFTPNMLSLISGKELKQIFKNGQSRSFEYAIVYLIFKYINEKSISTKKQIEKQII